MKNQIIDIDKLQMYSETTGNFLQPFMEVIKGWSSNPVTGIPLLAAFSEVLYKNKVLPQDIAAILLSPSAIAASLTPAITGAIKSLTDFGVDLWKTKYTDYDGLIQRFNEWHNGLTIADSISSLTFELSTANTYVNDLNLAIRTTEGVIADVFTQLERKNSAVAHLNALKHFKDVAVQDAAAIRVKLDAVKKASGVKEFE